MAKKIQHNKNYNIEGGVPIAFSSILISPKDTVVEQEVTGITVSIEEGSDESQVISIEANCSQIDVSILSAKWIMSALGVAIEKYNTLKLNKDG